MVVMAIDHASIMFNAGRVSDDSAATWVQPDIREGDTTFPQYPDQSIEDWHRSRNLWID